MTTSNGKSAIESTEQSLPDYRQEGVSAEQQARDLLERMGIEQAQELTAGDLVELANLINAATRSRIDAANANMEDFHRRIALESRERCRPNSHLMTDQTGTSIDMSKIETNRYYYIWEKDGRTLAQAYGGEVIDVTPKG